MRTAIDYGADAVYCGGEQFSLRTASRNFTIEELAEGLDYAHKKGKKVYLTLNIFAHNEDLPISTLIWMRLRIYPSTHF